MKNKTWLRVDLVQTGDGYINEYQAQYMAIQGSWLGSNRLIEHTVFQSTDPVLVSMAQALHEKDNEIKRLSEIIAEFKAAQERIMS